MSLSHSEGFRRPLFVAALLFPWVVGSLSSGPIAQAGSVSWGTNGNCNYYIPHGWSWTSWSGYLSTDSGSVYGQLDWWDGIEYAKQMSTSGQAQGSSNTAWADNYLGYNEQGTGSWRQWANHSGTMINGNQYSQHYMWC